VSLYSREFLLKALVLIGVIILTSPVFGIILSDRVAFHEPLELTAEELGLQDSTEDLNWTPFLDYTVPNLLPEMGYILTGFLGIGLILVIGKILVRVLK
jgi:cobalt/nickel transport protein